MSPSRFSQRIAVWLILLVVALACGLPLDATTLTVIAVLAICLS